ncbi:30S ribosomal protein S6 [Candidatus Uhrbacteria bacterium]|nr:30S ribosomal protein S6 [Candidatus Uhrbacteria bacterium]
MQTYELLYLTPLQDAEADRLAIRERVQNVIQDAGGAIHATREVARQRLSYPIDRHDSGEYTLVTFTTPGAALAGIERELRLLAGILRIMVTVRSERVRMVGAAVEAMDRQDQEKRSEPEPVPHAPSASAPPAAVAAAESPKPIEDLDKRLEEILGKEMA